MPAPRGRDFEKTRQLLAEWLHGKLPRATELVVSPLAGPAATGFSNDTLLFDLESVETGAANTARWSRASSRRVSASSRATTSRCNIG